MLLGFFLVLFIYPKFLSPEEIGLVRAVIDIAALFSPYILLGVPNTYVRFFPFYAEDKAKLSAFRFYSVLIPVLSTGLFLILYQLCEQLLIRTFEAQSALLVEYLDIIPILIFLMGANRMLRAYYRSDLNIVTPNFYESIILRIFFAGSVLFYYYGDLSVSWLVYLFIIANGVIFFFMLKDFVFRKDFKLRFNKSLSQSDVSQIMVFGVFVVGNTLTGEMILRVDTWMLSSLSGLAATGIYSVGMQMGTVIDLPKRSFSQITTPVISKAYKEGDWKQIKDLYHKTSLNQLLLGGFIFILMWTNAYDLFALIPNGDKFVAGIWVLLFIGLAKLFSIATGCTMEILQVSKYYRHTLWISMSLVVSAILLNLWLIPEYGITGAAIASALAQFLNNFILLLFVRWKLKIQPYKWENLFALLFLLAVLGGISFLELDWLPIVNVVLRSALVVAVFYAGIMFLPLSSDLRDMVKLLEKRVGLRR